MEHTILITGASGTVGKAAGDYLTSQGFNVIGVSRSISEDAPSYTHTEQIDLLEDDDLVKLEQILRNNDVKAVFHLAWNVSKENFSTNEKWEGNMEMFENILNTSERAGVPVFINGSSIHAGTGSIPAYTSEASLKDTPEPYRSSIDPNTDYELRKENPAKLLDSRDEDPDSPYGESKVEIENRVKSAVEKGRFKTGISIRIGGVNTEDSREVEGEPYYSSLYWSHEDIGRTLKYILNTKIDDMNGYYQFYGVSDNPGRIFNIENPFIGG